MRVGVKQFLQALTINLVLVRGSQIGLAPTTSIPADFGRVALVQVRSIYDASRIVQLSHPASNRVKGLTLAAQSQLDQTLPPCGRDVDLRLVVNGKYGAHIRQVLSEWSNETVRASWSQSEVVRGDHSDARTWRYLLPAATSRPSPGHPYPGPIG